MSYQFCCPQGHLLQGELSTVGQIMQCPLCGSEFHVPPPDAGATTSEGFLQGPGSWSTQGGQGGFSFTLPEQSPGGFPPPPGPGFGMPGSMQPMPQPPMVPGGPFAPPPFPAPQFGPMGELSAQSPAPSPKPAESPPASPSAGAEDRPKFELGFDPFAKATLPFDLPDLGAADARGNASAAPPTSSSAFLAGPAHIAPQPSNTFPPSPAGGDPAAQFPRPEIKRATALPSPSSGDFLAGPAEMNEAPAETTLPPKILHIRCPSGHVVKAPSELLGKLGRCPACKKTFELRYENSLEFKRRTEKILQRDENEAGKAWLGWIFVTAFLVFVALIGAVLIFGR
jgi:hypothetical protein